MYENKDGAWINVFSTSDGYAYEYGHNGYGPAGGGSRGNKEDALKSAIEHVKHYWGPLSDIQLRKIREVLEHE